MSVTFPPNLASVVRTIENDIYSHPQSVIEPLRKLVRQCDSHEQLCYAYEHLGFAFLLLSEHRMSKIFYEHALHLQPDNVYVLANLAHAVYELGDKTLGVEYGKRALRLKDQSAMAGGHQDIGHPYAGRTNLISFSLHGNKARYCETAVLNCLAAQHHFPGFVCRFYVDGSVPEHVIQRLRDHSAEIVPIKGRAASFLPTLWRFLAIDDEAANIVLVRDADSIIDARETHCVNEWIESGKPFHIIRDDCCHTELIHAGLFGTKSGVIRNVEERLATFLASKDNQPFGRFSDQLFLRKCVWPAVREHALTHDSVYSYGTDARSIPLEVSEPSGIRNHFIGANYASHRVRVSTQESFAESAVYFFRIISETSATICEYEMDLIDGRELEIFLPPPYAKRIDEGTWGYEIHSEDRRTQSRSILSRSVRKQ